MQTRSQQLSKLVFEQIMPMKDAIDNLEEDSKEKKEAKQYGSLCHNFPVMVLRSGLSQAIAFVLVKAKPYEEEGKQSKPHKLFLENLADLSGLELEQGIKAVKFQEKINTLPLMEYMRVTRNILTASIWYKRFAESILGVKDGNDAVEED